MGKYEILPSDTFLKTLSFSLPLIKVCIYVKFLVYSHINYR